MNALATPSSTPFHASQMGEMAVELAKMLALVAPTSMTSEQQELWLRAAIDALDDIRAEEVKHISAQVRRAVTRHNQVVPEIAKLVAELRARRSKEREYAALPPIRPPVERAPQPPLTQAEVDRMPKYLKDIGLRVGFLANHNGRIVTTDD